LCVALALVLAIAVGTAFWLGSRPAASQVAIPRGHDRGPAGVAAAYGYPPGCVSVTIPSIHDLYARADFNHATRCGRYTGDPTAIFRYLAGSWQPVLDAVEYQCPVSELPRAVQTTLGVCQPATPPHTRRADATTQP
jgi:hypothetical protein